MKLGAVSSAYGLVPRRLRGWLEKRHTPELRGLADPVGTHTYDQGSDLGTISSEGGVASIVGSPLYCAGDAVHGPMGWRSPAATGGGALVYPNPRAAGSSGSVYVTPRSIGSKSVLFIGLLADSGMSAPAVSVRLRTDQRIDIVDSGGARRDISKVSWLPDHTMRVDWRQVTTDAATTVTMWVYVGTNLEGWRPDDTLTATFPALAIGQVCLGNAAADTCVGYDTYREYDCPTVPSPYNPQIGAVALHTFDGGADGDPVLAGADLVQWVSGNPTYAGGVSMHGAMSVLIPAVSQGGLIGYDIPYPPAHTGSLYLQTAIRGSGDARVLTMRNGGTTLIQVFLRSSGSVSIKDTNGKLLGDTRSKCAVGDWTRLDWQCTWDGSALTLTLRFFADRPDSETDFSQIAATVPCTAIPDTLAVGTPLGTWQLYLDTMRTYGDVSSWPDAFDPSPAHLFSLIGDPTPDGVLISSMVLSAPNVDLAISTNSKMQDPTFVGPSTTDADHIVKHRVTGLNPGTTYFASLVAGQDAFGDAMSFTTLPASGNPATSMRIALVSCQKSQGAEDSDQAGWQDILDWDPHLVIHGGDFGYWGINFTADDPYQKQLVNYRAQIERLAVMRKLLMTRPSVIQVSDHETSPDNGDNYEDPITATALVAFQKLMPTTSYADPRDPIRGRFLAFNLNDNIRLISIDFRSLDRSPGSQPDGPTKTALGAVQMQWLTTELTRPEPLKIIASDPAWGPADWPPKRIPVGYLDKWWNYGNSQRAIAKIVTKSRTTTGGPINVDFWGNDRHLLGYLSGAHNTLGGFPVLCGSGIDQHALPLYPGEQYDHVFGCGESSISRSQYMRIELSDDGAGTITRIATGMDCLGGRAVFTAVDTWAY